MNRPFSQMAANCMYGCSFVSTRIGLTNLAFELLNPLEIDRFQFLADKNLVPEYSMVYILNAFHIKL